MEGLFKNTLIGERFDRLKKLNQGIMFFNSVSDKRVQEFILFMIQYGQLYSRGIDEFETIIGRYSENTEKIYNPEKKMGTPYTFKDTGEFFNSMYVTPNTESFIVDGDDEKVSTAYVNGQEVEVITRLFEKYGERIIGLTEDHKYQLGKMLADKYIEYVKEIL